VTWAAVSPRDESTAAVSAWTVETACEPLSVPLWMLSRSSLTWPIEALVG
jgi:hypothetical protein